MDEIRRIQDQLKRAFQGEAWHGPSLKELLRDVTAEAAAARPLAGAHTIWEIVLHIAAWKRAGVKMLSGEERELNAEEDWPSVLDQGNAAWQQALRTLDTSQNELRNAISDVSGSQLDQPVPGPRRYSAYFLMHGIIQHDLYHAGQIAILLRGK